jgi:CheY-like chemotaxis protein
VLLGELERSGIAVVNGEFVLAGNADKAGAERPEAVIRSPVVRRTLRPKRVLIVEDNLDSVRSLAYLVSDMGHKVEYAINGYASLTVARQFVPEFMLLDLGLPGMNGLDVCAHIKTDPELKTCRVVAFTAFSQQEYRDRAKAVGCELYWVKPVHTKLIEDLLG